MLTHIPSTTVQDGQQKPALLPTYPQHLVASLTPRQLRASLVGQQYYLDHFNGTHATHAQLCAFLKRKGKQWQYAHTSTEWQLHFIGGWYAALLADSTAEKMRPGPEDHGGVGGDTPITARPFFGGEDDDENNRMPQGELDALMAARPTFAPDDETEEHHPQGEPDGPLFDGNFAPIKAGEPTAPIAARATFGRDDDEECRPDFGPRDDEDEGFIICGEADAPVKAQSDRAVFGPEDGDETGWTLMKGGVIGLLGPEGCDGGWASPIGCIALGLMFAGEDSNDGGWSILHTFLFGPNGGDEAGWSTSLLAPEGGDGTGWSLVFGPKDGGQPGWFLMKHNATCLLLGPKDDGGPGYTMAPHEGNDDTWGNRCPSFGPEDEHGGGWKCIGEPLDAPIMARSWTRRPTFGPESDDEVGERCPSFGGEGEGDGEGFCLLPNCRPAVTGSRPSLVGVTLLARPFFGDEDDNDGGGCRSVFAPEDPTVDSLVFGPQDMDDGTWDGPVKCQARPLFGEEAEDGGYRPRQGEATRQAGRRPLFIDEDDGDSKGHRPSFGGEDTDDNGWGRYSRLRGGATLLARPTFAPEDPTVDSPIKCQARPSFIDDDDEDRYPSFGDNDDEEAEHGGWYRSRLPGSARQRGGGASLLTTPSAYPLNISLMGGDGRSPLFDDEKPDDDGWYYPRSCFPLVARSGGHGPIWPTEPPDADHSPRPRSLTPQAGITTPTHPLVFFGDDAEDDGLWGLSAHLHSKAIALTTGSLL